MATERLPLLLLNGRAVRYRSLTIGRDLAWRGFADWFAPTLGYAAEWAEVIDRAGNATRWRVDNYTTERRRSGRVLFRLAVSPDRPRKQREEPAE